jgi:hypothetical protein
VGLPPKGSERIIPNGPAPETRHPSTPYPSGTDAAQTSVYDDGGGNVLLYVDLRTYSTGNMDIYSFGNP